MNPVLILTHNCLELTKRCVESVLTQDVETKLIFLDNGSTDGTLEWLGSQDVTWDAAKNNAGVSAGWNDGLRRAFDGFFLKQFEYCLVINNDVILPPWFYSSLLNCDVPFVTGASSSNMLADDSRSERPEARLLMAPTSAPSLSAVSAGRR